MSVSQLVRACVCVFRCQYQWHGRLYVGITTVCIAQVYMMVARGSYPTSSSSPSSYILNLRCFSSNFVYIFHRLCSKCFVWNLCFGSSAFWRFIFSYIRFYVLGIKLNEHNTIKRNPPDCGANTHRSQHTHARAKKKMKWKCGLKCYDLWKCLSNAHNFYVY